MKLYNIFIKQNQSEIEDVIALRDEFSFWAFVFSGGWLLYKKMWREFLVFLSIFLIISSGFFSEFEVNFLNFVIAFLLGLNANYLLGNVLQMRGYKLAGVVFSDNAEIAKIRFLEDPNSITT